MLISLLTEVIPLVVEENAALPQGDSKDMKIRGFPLVEPKTIFDDKTNILPKFLTTFVNVQINLVENGSKIHRSIDNLKVFRTVVPCRIHRLAEQNSIMNVDFRKIQQLRTHQHQRLTPFPLDFVRLH